MGGFDHYCTVACHGDGDLAPSPHRILLSNGVQFANFAPPGKVGSFFFNGTTAPSNRSYAWTDDGTWLPSGSNDYYIQGWIYYTSTIGARHTIFIKKQDANNLQEFYLHTDGKLKWTVRDTSVDRVAITSSSAITPNKWYQFKLARESNTFTMYLDGVDVGNASYSGAVASHSGICVWGDNTAPYEWVGFMADLEVDDNGTTVFKWDGGGCDESFAPSTIVTSDGNRLRETAGPFTNSGSFYFEGTSTSYFIYPFAGNYRYPFVLGGNDFTIEAWINPANTSARGLFASWADYRYGMSVGFTSPFVLGIWASSNGTSWDILRADTGYNGVGTITLSTSTWQHVAFCHWGNRWMSFVDGVLDVDVTDSKDIYVANEGMRIGLWGSGSMQFSGSMAEIRVSRIARIADPTDPLYIPSGDPNDGFTPPTGPYTKQAIYSELPVIGWEDTLV